jgi:hypothetical protein
MNATNCTTFGTSLVMMILLSDANTGMENPAGHTYHVPMLVELHSVYISA